MAVVDIFVDHGADSGADMIGAGTVGNPFKTLSRAFTAANSSTANYRINVKGTSSGDPMTTLGSLPTGHSISAQITIGPYSSAAQDTDDLLYLDASGTDEVWDQDTVDAVVFNRCYFQNTSTDSGIFMDLDNNVLLYKCTFDNCRPQVDNSMGAYFCTWKNMVASGGPCFNSGSSSVIYGCNFSGSGTSTMANLTKSLWCINSVFYWDGTVDLLWKGMSAGGGCINNAFLYSSSSHSSGDGNGVMIDDQSFCAWNYFENCNKAIDDENNAEVVINGPNAFFGNTTNRFTVDGNMIDLTDPLAVADYDLTASGYPNASSGNWAMTDELRNMRTNQFTPVPNTSTAIEAHFGAFLKTADGSGGTTGRQGLHSIESGAV
tara:strand:+ start:2085 stop:3212 length:1128 start_codon:yes stop_codon:yes gene_type:complete